ncbi:MAG: phosphate--acyl-ACP acyltransferase, partial [Clostridiales bacterium]|nr:phosphate--acyl-ACP acyltransferase [Clostridiales bacterium]
GNILLKTCEGLAEFIFGNLKLSFKKNFKTMISALLIKKDLKEMASKLDSNSVGGTPLLGISKPVIKAHGSSNAEALLNAVKQAKSVYESRIIEEIESNIELMRL